MMNTGTSGTWDDKYLFAPSVLLDDSTYKMWYSASSTASAGVKIGYATSTDGIVWTKFGSNPVLTPGAAGSWDAK